MKRIYNPSLASELEELLNVPYYHAGGPECPQCEQTNPDEYELTGYVLDDGSGLFVEKQCKPCGAITDDGHGDFHQIYTITKHGIEELNA